MTIESKTLQTAECCRTLTTNCTCIDIQDGSEFIGFKWRMDTPMKLDQAPTVHSLKRQKIKAKTL